MRIVHLNPTDSTGGAARAVHRLHSGLRAIGEDSTLYVLVRLLDEPHVVDFKVTDQRPLAKLRRRLRKWRVARDFARYRRSRPPGMWLFSDDRAEHGVEVARQLPPCDVLNLHAMDGRIDYDGFFGALPHGLPVVWRMPEMQPFTGGCHYALACERFTARCGACPQLGSAEDDDLSRWIWRRKQAAFRHLRSRLHLVAPSNWIAAQARRSSLLGGCPVTVIPNGLDVDEWAPGERGSTRRALRIPADAKVVMFAAADVNNRLKGYRHLAEALSGLGRLEGLFLLTVGYGHATPVPGVPHLHLGKVASDRVMQMAYAAADVFAMPSLEESFGQTVTEAMACGTPVVAFAVGGVVDTVRPGATGVLAAPGDAAQLREGISRLLEDASLRNRMSAESRRVAVAEYSSELQARRYAALYKGLAAGAGRSVNSPNAAATASEPARGLRGEA